MKAATFLTLGRVSNLPTVWTNVLAAAIVAGASPTPIAIVAVAAAMSLFYCGGMFLNDAFDREIDATERPGRPIPSGQATASTVFALGVLQLVVGTAILVATARANTGSAHRALLAGVALTACIVTYDAFHKRNPLAPWIMGLCRALVYVGAGVALASTPSWAMLLPAAAALAVYTAGVTYVASVEASGRASRAWPLALIAAAAQIVISVAGARSALLPIAALAAWSAYALARAFRTDRPDVPGAVVRAIAGMCLLDAAWLWATGAHVSALLAVLGVPLTRLAQRRVAGT